MTGIIAERISMVKIFPVLPVNGIFERKNMEEGCKFFTKFEVVYWKVPMFAV